MNIVTTTSVFPPEYPADQILSRLAGVGFTCLDMAFDYCTHPDHPFQKDGWREWAQNLRLQAERLGVRYTHSHACGSAAARNAAMLRCFEVCAILGIKYLVVHPVYKIDDKIISNDEAFIRVNAEAIRPLLPYAEANNVTILSENLLWSSSVKPWLIADLVKTVNHPNFGWCFDTGHVNCSGMDISVLRNVSVVPLSLHIQDNHGQLGRDEHLLPGDGSIDWKEFLDILQEVGYQGDLVLEAHHQSLDAPDNERDALLSDLLNRTKQMKKYLESLS